MIESPIIVLGVPRSGTTLVQRCLSLHPDLWSLPAESHRILEGPFHPARSGYESNRVTADQVTPELAARLRKRFFAKAINLHRLLPNPAPLFRGDNLARRVANRALVAALGSVSTIRKPDRLRLLEKTPKNTLRVPLFEVLFPDARYIWLHREPVANITSIAHGWTATDSLGPFRRHRFRTYPVAAELELRDHSDRWWRFVLVPHWRSLRHSTVADVALRQYYECNRHVLADLDRIDRARVFRLPFEELLLRRDEAVRDVLAWADLPPSPYVAEFARTLPQVNRFRAHRTPNADATITEASVNRAIAQFADIASLAEQLGYSAATTCR